MSLRFITIAQEFVSELLTDGSRIHYHIQPTPSLNLFAVPVHQVDE